MSEELIYILTAGIKIHSGTFLIKIITTKRTYVYSEENVSFMLLVPLWSKQHHVAFDKPMKQTKQE